MLKKFFVFTIIFFGILLIPSTVQAATLFFSPGSGSYEVGDNFSVGLYVNSDGQDINAIQSSLSFSNNLLDVTSVSNSGIINLWQTQPTYSNANGTIIFVGGVIGGYNGGSGQIITIYFSAKSAGTASVSMSGSRVLANDGLGTGLLSGAGSGTYVISLPGEEPPPPAADLPETPTISSSTHPEQSLWYNNSNPAFTWTTEDGVTNFSYALDDQSDTVPDGVSDTTDTQASFSGISDGVWYIHVKSLNNDGWGPTGHYKIQIDITPPHDFGINLLDGRRTEVTTPRISFETTDDLSGIHHYDLITDGGDAIGLDVGNTTPFTLSELALGKHNITAIAYDRASNTTRASNYFTIVEPGAGPLVIIDEEVPDSEKPLADRLVDFYNRIIPAPIRKITDAIGNTIDAIKRNKTVTEIVDTIIEPVMTVSAIVAATSLAAIIASMANLYNVLYLFFRFGYFWLVPILLGKKRRSWGTVFDSVSGKSVARAIVRIFSREFNKLKESQITDGQGRFGFIIEEGSYYVTASAPGYVFPSHVLQTDTVSQYDNIYRGDTIDINNKEGGFFAMNIPIDPNMKTVSLGRLKWLKFVNVLGFVLEKISMPLLIAGTLLSWFTLIIDPKPSNYIILSLYAFLILMRYLVTKKFGKSLGSVSDKETGEPIEMAIVRIYNAETGTIASTRVTNIRGKFNALLSPGKYYLVIVKPDYETFKSKEVLVSRYKGYIKFSAELKRKERQPEILKEIQEGDLEIKLEAEDVELEKEKDNKDKNNTSKPQDKTKPRPPKNNGKKKINSKSNQKKSKSKKDDSGKPPDLPSMPSDLGDLTSLSQDS